MDRSNASRTVRVIVYQKCCWRIESQPGGIHDAKAIYSYDVTTIDIVALTNIGGVRIRHEARHIARRLKILFTLRTATGTDLYIMDIDGTDVQNHTPGSDKWDTSAFSPDGSKIVYGRCCFGSRHQSELFVMNADGTSRVRITDTKVAVVHKSVSLSELDRSG